MKRITLSLALLLSSVGLFANFGAVKGCTAMYTLILINSDGTTAIRITRTASASTCSAAMADAQGQVGQVKNDYIRWFTY